MSRSLIGATCVCLTSSGQRLPIFDGHNEYEMSEGVLPACEHMSGARAASVPRVILDEATK